MAIMPAGMHHASAFGGIGRLRHFSYGQCIHIGAQGDNGAFLFAMKQTDNARFGNVRFNLQAEIFQMPGDKRSSSDLSIGKLRMLVNISSPGDYLGFHFFCQTINFCFHRLLINRSVKTGRNAWIDVVKMT